MPDIREGIETGSSDGLDLDTEAGFNTFLARQAAGGEDLSDEAQAALDAMTEGSSDIKDGLTYGEESRPRDEHGRFAPKEQPVAEPEEEGAAPAVEAREEENTALTEFLARHGGDPSAALEAALKENEEAQKLIGRHATEVGETRKEQQELRDELNQLKGRVEAAPQQQFNLPPASEVEERGAGPNGDGSGFQAEWARAAQSGDLNYLEMVKDIWKQYDPGEALETWFTFQRELERMTVEKTEPAAAPERDPLLVEMDRDRQFKAAVDAVRATKNEQDWKLVAPELNTALESAPKVVLKAIGSADAEEQQEGIEALYEIAKARKIAQATATATEEAQAKQRASKQAAQVATGSLRPVTERKPAAGEEMSSEEIRKAFTQQLLETETTSVADSLEFGQRAR
jgi:hypothetical protein